MEEERSGECPTGGQNCTGGQGLLQHHWCLGCEGRGGGGREEVEWKKYQEEDIVLLLGKVYDIAMQLASLHSGHGCLFNQMGLLWLHTAPAWLG